jgi:hypothetical protein
MNAIVICLILNTLALAVYAVELYQDYDVILDNNAHVSSRIKYVARLIVSSIIFIIVLSAMYRIFNINTSDIFYYFKYGGK